MDEHLKALIDMPLDTGKRANGIWLPEGRRPAPRQAKPQVDDSFAPPVSAADLRARAEKSYSEKLVSLLDYYAGTAVPFERIAEHIKMDLSKVAEAMQRRGRAA